jgi:Holliday junction resolvasome RuvABC endonuclease subunit
MIERGFLARMFVLGIDFSTRSADFVAIPYDDREELLDEAVWRTIEVLPNKRGPSDDAIRAALNIRERLAGALPWDSVALTYIEEPWTQGRKTLRTLSMIEGAIVASLPLLIRRSSINAIKAQEWKRALTGRSDATKGDVRRHVEGLGLYPGLPQDAVDAAGIAWAARHENREAIARAEVFY